MPRTYYLGVVFFMVEDFEQDDWDMIDPSAKRVLVALSEFEKGLLVNVDQIHKKTGLMPEGLNDAVRHLSKAKLINNPEPSKRYGPYDFYFVEITDLGRKVLEKFG
jgi:DNA-binding MarR family transcriptional regulator